MDVQTMLLLALQMADEGKIKKLVIIGEDDDYMCLLGAVPSDVREGVYLLEWAKQVMMNGGLNHGLVPIVPQVVSE